MPVEPWENPGLYWQPSQGFTDNTALSPPLSPDICLPTSLPFFFTRYEGIHSFLLTTLPSLSLYFSLSLSLHSGPSLPFIPPLLSPPLSLSQCLPHSLPPSLYFPLTPLLVSLHPFPSCSPLLLLITFTSISLGPPYPLGMLSLSLSLSLSLFLSLYSSSLPLFLSVGLFW